MSTPRPRANRRRRLALIGAGALTLLVGGFLFVYFVLFPTSSPKRFTLTSATTATTPETAAASPGGASASGALSGSWAVSSGSEAGYRVREKLAFLPAESDAVGRTSQITGDATLSETGGTVTIRRATFSVAAKKFTASASKATASRRPRSRSRRRSASARRRSKARSRTSP